MKNKSLGSPERAMAETEVRGGPCVTHRYLLRRDWIRNKRGLVNFIMLNPSTADDLYDDATSRRCIGFAKRWGFSGLVVTNLFAFRATDPSELKDLALRNLPLAIGQHNDSHLIEAARNVEAIVCAWGNHGNLLNRDEAVRDLLASYDLWCIRLTKEGFPVHPVREAYTNQPILFSGLTSPAHFPTPNSAARRAQHQKGLNYVSHLGNFIR